MAGQGSFTSRPALLILVMAAVIACLVAWGIAVPGIGALARQWRQGKWLLVLEECATIFAVAYAGALYVVVFFEKDHFLYIPILLYSAYLILIVVNLGARWFLLMTRSPKVRFWTLFITTIIYVGNAILSFWFIDTIAARGSA